MELPELLIADAPAWREWLEQHHADSPGVWLVLHKKGGGVTTLTYGQALDEALCFGWIDGQLGRRDASSYRQRFTPRKARRARAARCGGRRPHRGAGLSAPRAGARRPRGERGAARGEGGGRGERGARRK